MGRFRKFLPFTAFAMVVAWLAIAGVPPFSGFFVEGRDHQPARSSRRLRPLDRRHRRRGVHRLLHDPPDLAHLLRQRALRDARRRHDVPIVSGGSGDDEPTREAERRRAAHRRATRPRPRRRPSTTATPPCRSRSATTPHESPRIMVFPIAGARGPRRVGGLLEPAVHEHRVPRPLARAVFRGVPEVAARHLLGGVRPRRCSRSPIALVGIFLAYTLYRSGLEHADRRPARTRSSARSAACLGHAYYYDEGISAARRRPGPRGARAGSTAWSTRRSSTARSTASAGCSRALARGVQQLQDGLVRRYALGIALGTVALLLYVVIWAGR